MMSACRIVAPQCADRVRESARMSQGIEKTGGTWEDEEVVLDGNLVTSRYPMDLPAFCREMLKVARKAPEAGKGRFPATGPG